MYVFEVALESDAVCVCGECVGPVDGGRVCSAACHEPSVHVSHYPGGAFFTDDVPHDTASHGVRYWRMMRPVA